MLLFSIIGIVISYFIMGQFFAYVAQSKFDVGQDRRFWFSIFWPFSVGPCLIIYFLCFCYRLLTGRLNEIEDDEL